MNLPVCLSVWAISLYVCPVKWFISIRRTHRLVPMYCQDSLKHIESYHKILASYSTDCPHSGYLFPPFHTHKHLGRTMRCGISHSINVTNVALMLHWRTSDFRNEVQAESSWLTAPPGYWWDFYCHQLHVIYGTFPAGQHGFMGLLTVSLTNKLQYFD